MTRETECLDEHRSQVRPSGPACYLDVGGKGGSATVAQVAQVATCAGP